ncbi:transposase [Corynebacterium variabile]|uniref:transposase n=1 Tax=Corynebacterium variabile TaxID=1727 RepID=UPI003FD6A7B8
MPAPRKYPDELRQRAILMVLDAKTDPDTARGAIRRVADQLGISRETLRGWVRRTEIDNGQRPGTTTDDTDRIHALEKESRELRRANEILKSASAFFAAELDRPLR